MDTALNLVALVAPVGVAASGIWAYLRIEDALDHRARLARLGHQPFHPMQLPREERLTVVNAAGQTPSVWFMKRSVDLMREGGKPLTRLDYLREFHPEKLDRRNRRTGRCQDVDS